MFGDNAIKHDKYLRLIVHLQPMTDQELATMERLAARQEIREVLGVPIPQVTIPDATWPSWWRLRCALTCWPCKATMPPRNSSSASSRP